MNCKNCEQQLSEGADYCNNCGAKVIRNRLTIRNLFLDFSEQFLNYDNKFLRTYLGVFFKPETVIGSYISGTRKKYVNVIGYFAIAITLSGIQIFIKFFPESMDMSVLVPETTPKASLDIDWVYDYFSIIALLNLPVYAFLSWLTFFRFKKFNYTEHLVIMTYLVAQFSISNAVFITFFVILFDANFYVIGYVSNFLLILFTAYTYKRLYPLKLLTIVLRTLRFFGIIIVLVIIFGIIQFIVLVLQRGFEKLIEDTKAQQVISYIVSSAMNWTS